MSGIPMSLEAEADFLGCCLISPEVIDESHGIVPNDFFKVQHQAIFEAITSLRAGGSAVTPISVWDEISRSKRDGLFLEEDGGTAALLSLANRAVSVHAAPHHAKLILRDSLMRKILGICSEAVERSRDRATDGVDLISTTVQKLLQIGVPGGDQPVRLGSKLTEVLDTIEAKATAPDKHVITTGLYKFDRIIGGFQAPQLVTIAARPGVGKTALALTIALHNARRNVPVLFFSLEMGFQELAERVISNVSRVPGHLIATGRVTGSSVFETSRRLVDVPLWIDDQIRTAPQIAAIARPWRNRLRSERGLVVIDYLGLIRSSGASETRAMEVGRMAWTAKEMAKSLAIPVILVSQLNRDSQRERRKPVLSDLRESGEIEQHSDVVIFPWRETLADGRVSDESGPASIIVAKHRGGPTGEIDCYWHASTMTFFDAQEDSQ